MYKNVLLLATVSSLCFLTTASLAQPEAEGGSEAAAQLVEGGIGVRHYVWDEQEGGLSPARPEQVLSESDLWGTRIDPAPGWAFDVDPLTGVIELIQPDDRYQPNQTGPGGPQETVINGSFKFISADCTNCPSSCPPVSRTVVTVLEAITPVAAGYGVSGLTTENCTFTGITEVGANPLPQGASFTITITCDVVACSSDFRIRLNVCDVAPALPTDACPP